jgi:hypothetical protein
VSQRRNGVTEDAKSELAPADDVLAALKSNPAIKNERARAGTCSARLPSVDVLDEVWHHALPEVATA